jgi:outer membrane protein OmpU
MKKVLFGTTTLVAAGLISGVASAETMKSSKDNLDLSIGGKMEQYFGGIGAIDDGNNEDGFGIWTDTELYFTGATTLDNGITVKAVIQLEAQTNANANADEQYVELSGSFGKIQAGQKEDAATQMGVIAPTVGSVGVNDIVEHWLGNDWYTATPIGFMGGDTTWGSDDATVSYFTPSFYGFSLGVSYTPNPGSARVPDGRTTNRDSVYASLGFSNEFSGVGIDADVGTRMNTSEDDWQLRSGVNLSYAGFTVGGSFMTTQGSDATSANSSANNTFMAEDSWVWDAGVSYEVGPYSVGFTYGGSEGGSNGGDQSSYKLGGAYNMGPGIDLVGNLFYAESYADGVTSGDAGSRSGVGAVAGVVLSF